MGQMIYYCAGADSNCLPTANVPAMLLNTLDHGANDKKIERAKQMRRIAKPKHVILDSSGYQILKAEEKVKKITFDADRDMKNTGTALNISPEHVMRVAAIHRPQIVIGLDFPIRKVEGEAAQEFEFHRKMAYNTDWAYASFEWRNALAPQSQYFQPIQCYTPEHLDIFFDAIKGVEFDGISMPIRTLKPYQLVFFLIGFYRRGITKIHLLGTSNFATIAICAYAARSMFEWVSLDSTSWRFAADKAEFIRPHDLARKKVKPGINVSDGPDNNCSCPNCHGRNFVEIQALAPRKDKVDMLRRHNWWALNNAIGEVWAASADLFKLEQFLKERCKKPADANELIRILSLVDYLKDCNIETLRFLLAPNPKHRNPARGTRKPTKPELAASEINQ
jgi:tRNA-guanine family transglycosylase